VSGLPAAFAAGWVVMTIGFLANQLQEGDCRGWVDYICAALDAACVAWLLCAGVFSFVFIGMILAGRVQ
jgi:hypothetical protein